MIRREVPAQLGIFLVKYPGRLAVGIAGCRIENRNEEKDIDPSGKFFSVSVDELSFRLNDFFYLGKSPPFPELQQV